MTGKSSSPQADCWVNGCQRTRRSRSWSSRVVIGGHAREGCGRNDETPTACDDSATDVRQKCNIAPAPARSRPPLSYPHRVPARRIQIVAAVVGSASLGAEIAAARLLAPWFGASTIIWANTIATVLVALSVGYW